MLFGELATFSSTNINPGLGASWLCIRGNEGGKFVDQTKAIRGEIRGQGDLDQQEITPVSIAKYPPDRLGEVPLSEAPARQRYR
jgi:hypothetical protein